MQRCLLSIAALFLVSTLASGQLVKNQNATKLKIVDNHNKYSDVWGYVAPDGSEYAIIGVRGGIAIINATKPLTAYEVAYFTDGFGCTWRDMKTYQNFIYEVNDCRPGVRVFDMADPENPTEASWFGTSDFNNAHNVQIDLDTGMLYAVGTSSGTHVYDLNANPLNPPLVTVWNGFTSVGEDSYEHDDGGNPGYVHDIFVKDGLAHAARIYAGKYTIADVSNLPQINTLASVNSGEKFAHSTWVNDDNTVAVVADETVGGDHISIYDISDPSEPTLLSNFSEDPISVPHNPFIVGDMIHLSWYVEGYICVDISDPSNPVRVARYDTTPQLGGGVTGFQGVWGCYPFQPSGFIYMSDRNKGLFILKNNVGCEPLPQNEPMTCSVWPEGPFPALQSPKERLIVTGNGLLNTTGVTVGGVPAIFNVKDDQVVVVFQPVVGSPGSNDIVITTSDGVATIPIEVMATSEPLIDVYKGNGTVVADEYFTVDMASDPGDLHYAVLGFSQIPSILPNKVSFDIGNGFTDLVFLPAANASAAGVSAIPMVLPASGIGLTVYWQMAEVTPGMVFPAPVSNVVATEILFE